MAVNVIDFGAKGDGLTDDTAAITAAIVACKAKKEGTVILPCGTYLIADKGLTTGVIPLLNGVSLQGYGKFNTRIQLSGGRHNPPPIFYQAWWNEPVINNLKISDLWLDGNISNQTFDSLPWTAGSKDYQYSHGVTVSNGSGIEISNVRLDGFRGDGLLFGDAFQQSTSKSKDFRIAKNISVHDCEFVDIYRQGILFACCDKANVYNNYFHGDGFGVAGIDIERHTDYEQVTNVTVNGNVFNFNDGLAPKERMGVSSKFRRAVSMGFFYAGYKGGKADGKSAGHTITNNLITQGMIDNWGHTNVKIADNYFNSVKEDLTGVGYITPYSINVQDAVGGTSGLSNVTITDNTIISPYLIKTSDKYSGVVNSGNKIN